MLDKYFTNTAELIEVKQYSKPYRSEICKINDSKNVFLIPTKFAKELSWKSNERVNLYRVGATFFLCPDKVGLITVHKQRSACAITSRNFCIEVMSRTHGCREFEAWVEEGSLFFKPKKGEE